jgi:HEAT repeat protein
MVRSTHSSRGCSFVARMSGPATTSLRKLMEQETVEKVRRHMWSTMGVWIGKSGQMTENDLQYISAGIAKGDDGALLCLHTACHTTPELLSNCFDMKDKLTSIVEDAVRSPTTSTVGAHQGLWLLLRMSSIDTTVVLSPKIITAMSDPTSFMYRVVAFSGSANGGGNSNNDQEDASTSLMLLEIATLALLSKERLNINMNEWKKPIIKSAGEAKSMIKGSSSKGGKGGGKGTKGAKGGKAGKAKKPAKKIRIAGMKLTGTKKVEKKTGDSVMLTASLGHHSHPLLMSIVASIGTGRSQFERDTARRIIIRSIQEDPSLTSNILETLRTDLRTRKITVRTTDDQITRNDRFQLASAYTSVLRCLVSSPEILQSDNLGKVLADIYYVCHHPLVSPERKRMSMKYSGDPHLVPRRTRTEWDTMSKLLSKHGVTMDMVSLDHLSGLLLSNEDGIVSSFSEHVRTCARRVLCHVVGSELLREKEMESEERETEVKDDGGEDEKEKEKEEEEEEEEDPSEITRRLAKTKKHLFISKIMTVIGARLDESLNQLKDISIEDSKVFNTPVGFLYVSDSDRKSIKKDGKESQKSGASMGLKGKQAHEWDAKVRSEVASKKAIIDRDKNSKEYKELESKQEKIRQSVASRVQPIQAILQTLMDFTNTQRDVARRWMPHLLPMIHSAVVRGASLVEKYARKVLISLCGCCPSPVHKVSTQLAWTYDAVMRGESLSNYDTALREIVEAVYAGTCGDEDENGNLPELLEASSHLVIPILTYCVKNAKVMSDKGTVIGCLQILLEHSDMPENMAAFWRQQEIEQGEEKGEEPNNIVLTLPVDSIRDMRSTMMEASLSMLEIAPNASDGLPGNVLEALCTVVPLSPEEWSILKGDSGLLSQKEHVRRRCLDVCKILVLSENDDTLVETLGESFVLSLWLLQHDDALEDDAHNVWVHHFGEDNDDVLPLSYAAPLLSLMNHDHDNVRTMSSIAIANAMDIHTDTVSATLNALYELYHEMNSAEIDISKHSATAATKKVEKKTQQDKFAKFYGDSGRADQIAMIKLKRTLCRVEVGRALGESAELEVLEKEDIMSIFQFLLDNGLRDAEENVQLQMTEAGMSMCNAHGEKLNIEILPMFEKSLKSTEGDKKNVEISDRVRRGVVLFMGTTARHLNGDDERLPNIVDTLIGALTIPSEKVQKTVSKCLTPLMKVYKTKSGFDGGRLIIDTLINTTLRGESYGDRRGAAWGLAGVTKGLGIACLTNQNVITRLKSGCQAKTLQKARQGALFGFECLANVLGILFEPFVIIVLEDMLLLIGDKKDTVREAAVDASRIVMSNLTSHGVKMVLPTLIKAFNAVQWRTKRASIMMLGAMAHAAPKQLANCLPQVVPKLTEALKDAQSRVKDAGKAALDDIASVIQNPEVVAIVPLLKSALIKPADHLSAALEALEDTDFVNPIDAASLAMIFPILHRSLRGRSGAQKRRAAQITADMTHMVSTPTDLVPYLPRLVPQLESMLTDGSPEVRLTSARSLGRLVRSLGEEHFPETVKSLCTGLFAKSTSVERSGHAQGLCEVLVALGPERLERVVSELIPQAEHENPHVREGTMWLLAFLPATMGTHFSKLIPQTLPVVLKRLEDDVDSVREVSLRAGQVVIGQHGLEDSQVLLPLMEDAMFDENWRIRKDVCQMLGELLHRVGGGRISYNPLDAMSSSDVVPDEGTEEEDKEEEEEEGDNWNGDDDDEEEEEEEEEERNGSSSRTMSSQELLSKMEKHLGQATLQRLLAKIYMLRADPNFYVKQTAQNVWKGMVTNTGRVLRGMLVSFMDCVIEFLSNSRDELRIIAGGSLGDIVTKMGDRVTSVVLPILEKGMTNGEDAERQGVCLGLLEIITASNRRLLEANVMRLMPIVQTALCDELEDVCETAAQCFNVMQSKLGGSVIDTVVPLLLRDLNGSDEVKAELSMQGLRQLLLLRGRDVMAVLIPKLIPKDQSLDLFRALTLSEIAETTGDIMHHHVGDIMKCLLNTLQLMTENNYDEDLSNAVKKAMRNILVQCNDEEGLQWTLLEYVNAAVTSESPTLRSAALWCLGEFCEHTTIDFDIHIGSIAVALLDRFFDLNLQVLESAHKAMTQLNDKVTPEVLSKDMKQLRVAITSAISREKFKKRDTDLINSSDIVISDPLTNQYVVPGFCRKKGLGPVLPVFLYGLTYGSADLRESSAAGMGEVLAVSTNDAVKPFLMKVTGPLIRVLGDRYQAPVKIETLKTILLLLSKGGKRLRPFIPQLQTTFVKNLSDPSHIVRDLSATSLTQLMEYVTRVDQLVKELKAMISSTVGGVQLSMMKALYGVMSMKGEKISSGMMTEVIEILLPMMTNDPSMDTKKEASKCLGIVCHYIESKNDELTKVMNIICNSSKKSNVWEDRYVCTQAISSILSHGIEHPNPSNNILINESLATIIKTIKLLCNDDNGSVREGACQTVQSLLQMSMVGAMGGEGEGEGDENGETKNNQSTTEMESLAALLLVKAATKDPSTDVRTAACCAIMKVARDSKINYFGRLKVRKILLPAVVTCAMDRKNVRMRTSADRALYFCLRMQEDTGMLETRVRKNNANVLKGAKGSQEMIAFVNKHWSKVARLIPESSWNL